jgi:hypothetical protein
MNGVTILVVMQQVFIPCSGSKQIPEEEKCVLDVPLFSVGYVRLLSSEEKRGFAVENIPANPLKCKIPEII